MYLLKYQLSDGAIVGSWSANDADLLAPSVVVDDPTYGYLLEESLVASSLLETLYYVEAGVLEAKTEVTITATPATFDADGIDTSSLTITPFVACTLRVDGTPYALTVGDPTLVLTSEVPQVFVLELAPHPTVWATPQTVEAI